MTSDQRHWRRERKTYYDWCSRSINCYAETVEPTHRTWIELGETETFAWSKPEGFSCIFSPNFMMISLRRTLTLTSLIHALKWSEPKSKSTIPFYSPCQFFFKRYKRLSSKHVGSGWCLLQNPVILSNPRSIVMTVLHPRVSRLQDHIKRIKSIYHYFSHYKS